VSSCHVVHVHGGGLMMAIPMGLRGMTAKTDELEMGRKNEGAS